MDNNGNTLYVIITKCDMPSKWYARHVGKIYPVTPDERNPGLLQVIGCSAWIARVDCWPVDLSYEEMRHVPR